MIEYKAMPTFEKRLWTLPVITPSRDGLWLDVRLVSLCYNMPYFLTAAARLPGEQLKRRGGAETRMVRDLV